MKFENKVVMITGASSGIGEALAREFGKNKAALVLLARRVDRLERIAKEIGKDTTCIFLECDVTKEDHLIKAVQATRDRFGRIDIVVANAGFGVVGRFETLSVDDYRRQFETNVFGVIKTIKTTLEDIKASKGTIVIVGSISGHISMAGSSAYCMSKFAIRALAESLYLEMKDFGVNVVLVSPGFVESEIRKVDNLGHLHPNAKDPVPRYLVMPAQHAAREILEAIRKRKQEAVITGHGKLLVGLNRLCPSLIRFMLRFAPERRKPSG